MRVSVAVRLALPPEHAWSLLVDWESQPRWMKDADSVRVLGPRREGVGVRLAVRTQVLGVPALTEVLEVERWEPPRRLVIAHRSFVRGLGVWVVEPAVGGSVFRWVEELHLPFPVLGELALLVYRPLMRRLMRASARGLARAAGRYRSESA